VKPRLLDLFCGAGGATKGYQLAGFHVTGVDINPQPNYCGDAFHQADAMTFPLEGYDLVHASPPCQAYTAMRSMHNHRKDHPLLIEVMRSRLNATGATWVIENVPGAPMPSAIQLCGTAFGLGVEAYDGWRELRRHRWFESSRFLWGAACSHRGPTIGLYGDHARDRRRRKGEAGRDFPDRDKIGLAQTAMGMPWVDRWRGLTEAIPPAYTRFLGDQLLGRNYLT
jgi:DNA (cytosine-5)-methyltransferase 1